MRARSTDLRRSDTTIRALPQVTTASLPALKSYALARQSLAHGDRVLAVEHAERAVAHDNTFVLAHYLLGDVLWFLDRRGETRISRVPTSSVRRRSALSMRRLRTCAATMRAPRAKRRRRDTVCTSGGRS